MMPGYGGHGSPQAIRSEEQGAYAASAPVDIQKSRGVAYLMITHDISIARAFADRVAVMMKGGRGDRSRRRGAGTPAHEYTRRLIAAVPELD
jgi:ABC-type dipeptide/oligopeptide/nickel transport system ATPase component